MVQRFATITRQASAVEIMFVQCVTVYLLVESVQGVIQAIGVDRCILETSRVSCNRTFEENGTMVPDTTITLDMADYITISNTTILIFEQPVANGKVYKLYSTKKVKQNNSNFSSNKDA